MSERLVTVEGTGPVLASTPSMVPARFDLKLAQPFIYKSVSEETRGLPASDSGVLPVRR